MRNFNSRQISGDVAGSAIMNLKYRRFAFKIQELGNSLLLRHDKD